MGVVGVYEIGLQFLAAHLSPAPSAQAALRLCNQQLHTHAQQMESMHSLLYSILCYAQIALCSVELPAKESIYIKSYRNSPPPLVAIKYRFSPSIPTNQPTNQPSQPAKLLCSSLPAFTAFSPGMRFYPYRKNLITHPT